jgi:hypothetical protein
MPVASPLLAASERLMPLVAGAGHDEPGQFASRVGLRAIAQWLRDYENGRVNGPCGLEITTTRMLHNPGSGSDGNQR